MKTAVVVLVLATCAHSANFPNNFKKCSRQDPDPNKCYAEAAQVAIAQLTKAYQQINLPSFEPLEITELNIGAGSQGVVNVDQKFKNCKLYGISEAKINDFEFNLVDKYLHAKATIPNLKKVCDYELNGKILLLPIVGTGPSTINLKNVNVTVRFDYEEVTKKGKTYMNFNKQALSLEPESISFAFENLFNGDKALGDNINKVLNENDKEVFGDVRKGYEEGIGLVLMQILHNLFAKVSIEEAFD